MSDQTDNLRQFAQQHGLAPQAAQASGKDRVLLPGGSTKISDTARAIFGILAAKRAWFYRGGAVVVVARENEQSLPVAQILKPARARSEVEQHADLFSQGKDGPKPDVMSEDTAKAILESSVAKEVLPHLTGLINCPLLILRDGQLHTLQPGYNAATGYYLTGAAAKESASLEEAVAIITGVIADYSFQTPGDISRALASFMTPLLKMGGFIRGRVPIEIVEADDSQTGKGYFVLLKCAVYGEIPTYVAFKKGGVGSLDESLGSALVKGRPVILIDNFRGGFNSPFTESLVTAEGTFSVRVPHSGEIYIDPSRFFLSITSNGMESTKDLANRSCFIRLEKQRNQRFQQFDGNDMLTTVRLHQPMFLGAVFTIIRHWFNQGMPRTEELRHTCRDWAQITDWIVQNIFEEAPLLERHEEVQERFQNPSLTFARLLAIEIEHRHRLEMSLTATEIFDICEDADIPIPQLRDQQRHNQEHGMKVVGKTMSKLFGSNDEVAIEGFVITREHELQKTESGNTQDRKKYTFTRADEQTAEGVTAAPMPAAPTPATSAPAKQ